MTVPAAICFDLDETLLDTGGLGPAIAETCELVGARLEGVTAAELLAANGAVWGEYWPEVEADWNRGALSGAAVSRESWQRTLAAVGVVDRSSLDFTVEAFGRLARAAHRLYPDAQPAVEEVRARGILIALITNGASDTQREKIDALGIEPWFDVIVVCGEMGVAKPAPAPFRAVLDALRVTASEAWHVGDGLATDVAGAKGAGLTSVWLNRRGTVGADADTPPDFAIRSLAELSELPATRTEATPGGE